MLNGIVSTVFFFFAVHFFVVKQYFSTLKRSKIKIYDMYWLKIVLLSLSRHGPKWYYTNRLMVFNTTFNNISVISWQSVLLVEEIGVPGENH